MILVFNSICFLLFFDQILVQIIALPLSPSSAPKNTENFFTNSNHEWDDFWPKRDDMKLNSQAIAGPVHANAVALTKTGKGVAVSASQTFIKSSANHGAGNEPNEKGTPSGEQSGVHAMAQATGTADSGNDTAQEHGVSAKESSHDNTKIPEDDESKKVNEVKSRPKRSPGLVDLTVDLGAEEDEGSRESSNSEKTETENANLSVPNLNNNNAQATDSSKAIAPRNLSPLESTISNSTNTAAKPKKPKPSRCKQRAMLGRVAKVLGFKPAVPCKVTTPAPIQFGRMIAELKTTTTQPNTTSTTVKPEPSLKPNGPQISFILPKTPDPGSESTKLLKKPPSMQVNNAHAGNIGNSNGHRFGIQQNVATSGNGNIITVVNNGDVSGQKHDNSESNSQNTHIHINKNSQKGQVGEPEKSEPHNLNINGELKIRKRRGINAKENVFRVEESNADPLSFDLGGSQASQASQFTNPWGNTFDSDAASNNMNWATGHENPANGHAKVPVSYEKNYGSSQSKAYKNHVTEDKNNQTAITTGHTETEVGEHQYAQEVKNESLKAMEKVKSKKSQKIASSHIDESGVEKAHATGNDTHYENSNITEHDGHTNETRHRLHEKKLEIKNGTKLHKGTDGVTRVGNYVKRDGFETLNASHVGDNRTEKESIDRKIKGEKIMMTERNDTVERRVGSDKIVSVDSSAKFKNISGVETHEGKSKSLTAEVKNNFEGNGKDSKATIVNNTYATDTMSLKKKSEYKELSLAKQKVRGSEAKSNFTSVNGTKKSNDFATHIGSDTASKINRTADGETVSSLQTSMIGHKDRQGLEKVHSNGTIEAQFTNKNDNQATQKELTVYRLNKDNGDPDSETIIQRNRTKADNEDTKVKQVYNPLTNLTQSTETGGGNSTNSTFGFVKYNILSKDGKVLEAAALAYQPHTPYVEPSQQMDDDIQSKISSDQSAKPDNNATNASPSNNNAPSTSTSQVNNAHAGNIGNSQGKNLGIQQNVATSGNGNIIVVLNNGDASGQKNTNGNSTAPATHIHIDENLLKRALGRNNAPVDQNNVPVDQSNAPIDQNNAPVQPPAIDERKKIKNEPSEDDNGAGAAAFASAGEWKANATAKAASHSQHTNTKASAGPHGVSASAVVKRRKSKSTKKNKV